MYYVQTYPYYPESLVNLRASAYSLGTKSISKLQQTNRQTISMLPDQYKSHKKTMHVNMLSDHYDCTYYILEQKLSYYLILRMLDYNWGCSISFISDTGIR